MAQVLLTGKNHLCQMALEPRSMHSTECTGAVRMCGAWFQPICNILGTSGPKRLILSGSVLFCRPEGQPARRPFSTRCQRMLELHFCLDFFCSGLPQVSSRRGMQLWCPVGASSSTLPPSTRLLQCTAPKQHLSLVLHMPAPTRDSVRAEIQFEGSLRHYTHGIQTGATEVLAFGSTPSCNLCSDLALRTCMPTSQ